MARECALEETLILSKNPEKLVGIKDKKQITAHIKQENPQFKYTILLKKKETSSKATASRQ